MSESKNLPDIPIGEHGLEPKSMDQMIRFAGMVIKSGLAPKSITTEAQVCIALQMGYEVGLKPLQALQSIAVINGKPSIYGDAGLALVRGSGLMENYEERFITNDDGEIIGCTAIAWRKGQEAPIARTFDKKKAARAGLLNKSGPWKEYPDRMYMFRARSWCLRDGFGDVLGGLAFVEEQRDIPQKATAQAEVQSVDDILASARKVEEEPQEAEFTEIPTEERKPENGSKLDDPTNEAPKTRTKKKKQKEQAPAAASKENDKARRTKFMTMEAHRRVYERLLREMEACETPAELDVWHDTYEGSISDLHPQYQTELFKDMDKHLETIKRNVAEEQQEKLPI